MCAETDAAVLLLQSTEMELRDAGAPSVPLPPLGKGT